jgi:hypothetical protein
MNKELFAKVKDKCKDMGLSEKCLTAITEAMGGSVADDSTDTDAIESTANLIVSVATASQSEATRWVNKAKGTPKPKTTKKDGEEGNADDDDPNNTDPNKDGKGGGNGNPSESEAIKKLQEQIDALKAEKSKGERTATINAAFEKHNIPAFLRERLAKSISDDEDVEAAVSALKQDCITNGLMSDSADGAKAASEKQVDEAADALLESITAK